jgi:hypothetical protein
MSIATCFEVTDETDDRLLDLVETGEEVYFLDIYDKRLKFYRQWVANPFGLARLNDIANGRVKLMLFDNEHKFDVTMSRLSWEHF